MTSGHPLHLGPDNLNHCLVHVGILTAEVRFQVQVKCDDGCVESRVQRHRGADTAGGYRDLWDN